jgi:hypothetical protein
MQEVYFLKLYLTPDPSPERNPAVHERGDESLHSLPSPENVLAFYFRERGWG